jgi:glycosyltransferase involved in cell wall biosynthesis
VVVDNMSTDKTSDVIDQVQDVAENYGVNLIRKKYEIEVHRYGDNYQRKLFDRPDGSIADFYNYAFSEASGEYVFKLDAGCIFFPNAIRRFVSMVSNDRPLIRYRGIETFGSSMAYEPSIIKRELFGGFRDSKNYEEIILSRTFPKYDIRNFYLPPAFFHYRRLLHPVRT